MRGSPIWQVVFVVLMFAAAGLPVWRLTTPALAPTTTAAPVLPGLAASETPLQIGVSFTPAPADFALRYLGETTVLTGQGPAADFAGQWSVNLPTEGVDLTLQAHWPEGTPGHVAARVTVRFPNGRETTETFWRETGGSMVETLTIKP